MSLGLADLFTDSSSSGSAGASSGSLADLYGGAGDVRQRTAAATGPAPDIDSIISEEGAGDLAPVIKAIYGQESGSGANARTSTDGAVGDMQVMPATFRMYAKPGEAIGNRADNVRAGVRYIKDLGGRFGGDPGRIAAGYFSGAGNVNAGAGDAWKNDRADGNGKRVSGYVADVLGRMSQGGATPQQQAAPALPDLSAQPKWHDVAAGARFRALDDAEKQKVKSQYFDELIAPHVQADGGDVTAVRSQFLSTPDATGDVRDQGWVKQELGQNEPDGQVPEGIGESLKPPAVGEAVNDAAGALASVTPWGLMRTGRQLLGVSETKPESTLEGRQMPDKPVDPAVKQRVDKLISDDLERIAKYGTIGPIVGPDPSVGSVAKGLGTDFVTGAMQARAGVNKLAADVSGVPELAADARREAGHAELLQARNAPNIKDPTLQGAYSGVSSTVQQLPSLALGIATGNPELALVGMVAPMLPQGYSKYRERGATPGQAALGALGETASEYLTERMPMRFLVDRFGKAGAGNFLTGLLARELPSEQVAQHVQDAIDTAIANPDKTWGDYWAERPDAAYQTLMATATQSALIGGGHTVAKRLLDSVDRRLKAANAPKRIDPTLDPNVVSDATPVSETPAGNNVRIGVGTADGAGNLNMVPDPGLPPAQPPAHPTVQAADSVVADLANEAGIPLDTVLPADSPARVQTVPPAMPENAPADQVSDTDVTGFAQARLRQLLAKRDGQTVTVPGPTGPQDVVQPGEGLSSAERQELDALGRANGDMGALRQLYGLDGAPAAGATAQTEGAQDFAIPAAPGAVEQAAPEPQASEAPMGQFPTRDEAAGYISQQRRNASIRLPAALPVERADGTFDVVTQGQPGFEEAQATARVNDAAHEAATSQQNDTPAPTDGQIEAGNYKKGHLSGPDVQGLNVTIENPKGSMRSGTNENGKPWSVTMPGHYGYVRGSEASDGEQVDITVGPHAATAPKVWVVDQINQKTGAYDEAKALFGFDTKDEALAAYRASFEPGWQVGPVTEMTVDGFKQALNDGELKKPLAITPAPTGAPQTKPRLAENADDLWRAIQNASGGVTTDRGIRYPTLRVVGGKDYALVGKQLRVLNSDDGGMSDTAATPTQEQEFYDALKNDQVQVLLQTRPGHESGHGARQVVRELHSPSGQAFASRQLKGDAGRVAQAPAEPEFTTVPMTDGRKVTVRTADLKGDEPRLRQYTPDGQPKKAERVHRADLAPTGEAQRKTKTEGAVSRPTTEREARAQRDYSAKWFGSREKADAFIEKQGIASSHEVQPRGSKFYIIKKGQTNGTQTDQAEQAGAQRAPAGAETAGAVETRAPTDFVPAPGGSLNYGEITPAMAKEMGRQAGKIRLQQGVQNPDGTGWGLVHIEARHGREIRAAGFGSVQQFVAEVFRNMDAAWRPGATRQVVVVQSGRHGKVAFVQLEIGRDGDSDFYRINSAFPAGEKFIERKRRLEGWEPLWSRYPVPADASGASGFVDQSPKAGETAPTVEAQSGNVSVAGNGAASNRGEGAPKNRREELKRNGLDGQSPDSLAATERSEAPSRRSSRPVSPSGDHPDAQPNDTSEPLQERNAKPRTEREAHARRGQAKTEGAGQFADNKIFTADKVSAARERLKSKLGRMNTGIDPELLADGLTVAGAYIESGVRRFSDYAKAMVRDLGESVRPYLRSFYEAARHYPGLDTTGMTTPAELALMEREGTAAPMLSAAIDSEKNSTDNEAPAEGAKNAKPIQTEPVPAGRAVGDRAAGADGRGSGEPVGARVATGGARLAENGRISGRAEGTDRAGREGEARSGHEPPVELGKERRDGTERGATSSDDRHGELAERAADGRGDPTGYVIQDGEIGKGSLATKYRDNVTAIKILKALDVESRKATPAERKALAKYVGWGAMKGPFDPENKSWAKQHEELKALLTPEEWKAARASTLDAHYTSPVVVHAMYDALSRIGFDAGRVLEPAVGAGNFFGMMPRAMRNASDLHGVELDALTSKLVTALYPNARIAQATGFQDYDVPSGYFDLVIGNPPFGSYPLVDKERGPYSGFSVHNYFLAKGIDKLRPGGIMAVVVSHNFLDAQDGRARQWIAGQADLIGGARLPNTAFKENAGTEVVTDVLVFRKRAQGVEPGPGQVWQNVVKQTNANPKTGESAEHHVNQFFVDNPKFVLGEPSAGGTMYRANEYTVVPNGELGNQLNAWADALPQGVFESVARLNDGKAPDIAVPSGVKVGSYFVDTNGRVMQRGGDVMGGKTAVAWQPKSETAKKRMKGMIALRDALREQMRMERSPDASEAEIEDGRKSLNALYDDFLKQYGHLNSQTNRRIFLDDTEAPLVQALEFDYDKGVGKGSKAVVEDGEEPREPSAKKADIFQRRVAFPPQDFMAVATAKDALLASLNFRGKVDGGYMAEVYGKPMDAIVRELGDVVFDDPQAGVVLSDEYLSGDVKTKLAEAKAAVHTDPKFERNVKALEAVIPKDKRPSEINVSVGAAFIPAEVYRQFVKHITGGGATLNYLKATGQWVVAFDRDTDPALNTGRFGTSELSAQELFALTLQGRGAVVKRTYRDGSGKTTTVVLEKETEAAREKQNAIKAEWQKWLWQEPERADQVAAIYNDTMNRIVGRQFDGAHMTFPGMNPAFSLLPHQKNGVWRGLQTRQILYDHVVGAGKTFEMAALAMEMRRLGIARKPLFVVPNHLTLQWRSEFTRLYPGARTLIAMPEDFEAKHRERFFSKIVTGDWDAVVIGHSSLKRIGLPPATEQKVLEEQLNQVADAIEEMKRSRGDRRIVADMERIRKTLDAKMKDRIARIGERSKVVTFDELGIDAMFIDEMHEFKNLAYNSTMDRNPGMGNPTGSAKAFDLFVKTRWMFDTFGDKTPYVAATGTPVSNSLVEMFNMQRYLQYPTLKAAGLNVFDAWARQFGNVENVYEVAPSGSGYRQSTRFAKFANLPALMSLYNSFADTITLDDLREQSASRGERFPVPKIAGGKPALIVAERSPQVAALMGEPAAKTDAAGHVMFSVDLAKPVEVQQDAQSGKWIAKVGDAGLGAFETEQEARLKVAELALTPEIETDPRSILGRFANLRQLTKDSKGKVNALSLTNEANKAGLDYRLIDPKAPDFPGSKINLAIDQMMRIYKQWGKDKGAQLVFSDLSIPLSARASYATKERRLYVRGAAGEIEMKRGTLHAIEGHGDMPFFVVSQGEKEARTFGIYDAMTGLLIQPGFRARKDAVAAAADILNDDAKRGKWSDEREVAGEIDPAQIDDYNTEHEVQVDDPSRFFLRDDIDGTSGSARFSVYDDIKTKLMARGVPEREIAFIHDYNTPSAKEKLFKAVNAGEVRFLLGSTQKMGAGTNVQERLVGLHHIDAPWRPSDLEQREGRIIRRGNKLYERDPEGFEVFIGRYATRQTYDTRRWQILEHKARGIEQLRNYDGTTNEIDDVAGEAANSADMKAAASGDPLILEETRLRGDVTRLERLQAAHADEVLALTRKARAADAYANKSGPDRLKELEALQRTVDGHPDTKEDPAPIMVAQGRPIADRQAALKAIGVAFERVRTHQVDRAPVSYRGLKFELQYSDGWVRLSTPTGFSGAWSAAEAFSPSGFVQRLKNYVERLPAWRDETQTEIGRARQDVVNLREQAKQPFDKVEELQQARGDYKIVQRKLMAKGPEVTERQRALVAGAIKKQRTRLEELGFGDALQELPPAFSRAGDAPDRGIASATVTRSARTFQEARVQAKAFQGKPLVNEDTGFTATVSRNNLDKMLSEKAMRKSSSSKDHARAVANLDQLFERALLGWSKADNRGDPNIRAIHRFFTPIVHDGRALLAKLTVKETIDPNHANPLYTVEAVEFNEKSPAAQWVDAASNADGIDLTSIRSARDVLSLAQRVQQFNRSSAHPVAVSVPEVEAMARKIMAGMVNAPELVVVQRARDLPFKAPDDAKGVYLSGRLYLVAANLGPVVRGGDEIVPARVVIGETVAHELIGHFGMRGFFGKEFGEVLKRIHGRNVNVQKAAYQWKQHNADVIAQWKKDFGVSDEWVKLRSIDEALAGMAERGEKLEGWRWLALAAQKFLRRIGLDRLADRLEAKTDAEARAALRKAEMFVRTGQRLEEPVAEPPAFSRKGDAPDDFHGTVERTQKSVMNLFGGKDGLKTFGGYDKTLATQYHKALKDPHYGRVFGLVNAMQNLVSLVSIRPAELAPGLLPKVNDVRAAVMGIVRGRGANANLDKVSKAVFAGTLAGDSVLQGKVWSDAGLRGKFGLDDTGVALYHQARAAIDASLDELSAAEAWAVAQKMIPPETKRAVIDDPRSAEGVIISGLDRQIRVLQTAVANAKRRGAKEQQAALESVLDTYLKTHRAVDAVFKTAADLKKAGYAPLMRFGKYTVTVEHVDPATGKVMRDDEGNPLTEYFGKFETKGEAVLVRNQMQARYAKDPDMRVRSGVDSETAHEMFAGISPETIALFGEAVGDQKATETYYRMALSERSALKRRLHRKGTAGFSMDLPRALSNFITSNGRFAAQRYYLRDVNEAIRGIPQEKGDVRDEAQKLKRFVMNPSDPAAPASSIMFSWFLGGSVASALVNLTQPVMMTYPYLSQWGPGKAAAAMTKATPYAFGKKEIADRELRAGLKRASQEGIVDAQEIFHLYSAGAQGVATWLANKLAHLPGIGKQIKAGSENARARINAFMTLWGSMFAAAEGFNRRVTFIAAWNMAKAQKDLGDPYAFAVRAVNETQGIYNKVNRPNWARGPAGRLILTFKQFSIMNLELLSRMWKTGGPEGKRAVAIMLAILMLAAGEEGLPFAKDLDNLIDTIGQLLGYDTNVRRDKRKLARSILGKQLGDLFLYGISTQLPTDFAARLGLGELIPGSGMLKASDKNLRERNVADVFGPAAGLVGQVADAYDAAIDGNAGQAFTNLAPTAIKNAISAASWAKKGYATDTRGRKVADVGLADVVSKAIGFNPTAVAQKYRKTLPIQQDIALQRRVQASIAAAWSQAITDDDQKAIDAAIARRDAWNERNPDMPVIITPAQLKSRVRSMGTEKDTRILKSAPRSMRGNVGQELAQ